jgi:glycosyltransferase involved in cell wall biosynthesis
VSAIEGGNDTVPLVSVVIPSSRGGPYLREAVATVLAQTFTAFELIVVADGCDDPLEDLERVDPRLRILRQRNRGESVARNVGVRAARTDLVAFVDDDDRMLPGRLAAQFAAMDHDPEVGLCHTQFRFIDEHGAIGASGYSRDVQYLDLLRKDVRVLMPTTMIRKSVLEEVGTFDSTLRTGQDLEVIYRIARDSRLHFVPEALTEYRRHSTNASGDRYQAAQNMTAILSRHLRNATALGNTEAAAAAATGLVLAHQAAATSAIDNARMAWRQKDLVSLPEHLRSALVASPGYTVRDLVGNRRPLSALGRRTGRRHDRTDDGRA